MAIVVFILMRHKRRYIYICLQLPTVADPDLKLRGVGGGGGKGAPLTYLMICSLFRSESIGKSAYVNSQSPR